MPRCLEECRDIARRRETASAVAYDLQGEGSSGGGDGFRRLLRRWRREPGAGPAPRQERDRFPSLDGEVHVLRDVTQEARRGRGIELGDDDTDDVAGLVEKRASRIAGLHRGADLQVARIVVHAGGRAHNAGRQVA